MTAPLDFYFDVISPYAYLAWHDIHEFAGAHGRDVRPVPVLFAGLLNVYGQKGPAEIAPKRMYTFKNVARLAHDRGVALEFPPAHPFNPLLALRIAGLDMAEDTRRGVIDALFAAVWAGGPGVTDPDAVADVLTQAGYDGAALVEQAQQPEAKARLRASTDAAVSVGVFGVPTMVCDGELFWGADSLPHIARFLAGDDPITPELVERVRTLPAQATRPPR
ncbi:2-hydroxychromene-2-carboxylate isomerase [Haliangium sp.]|uniref:2-hydroxychromene-2-carboxylate isomerase n=1 Tax=Haliangium sp. TaxID=2663208 RepID=UPI003D0DB9FA